MNGWLEQITTWLVDLVKDVFVAVWDLLGDGIVFVLSSILVPIGGWISGLTPPAFLSSGINIGALLTGLPPFALYLAGQTRITEAMAILGAAVGFHLLRKMVTLGQW